MLFAGVIIMNPFSVYLDAHENYTWRTTLRIYAVVMAIVSLIYLIVINIPKSWVQADTSNYQDLDKQSDDSPIVPQQDLISTKTTDENTLVELEETMTSSRNCPDIAALTWVGGLFFVSAAIYIPKTLFVSTSS